MAKVAKSYIPHERKPKKTSQGKGHSRIKFSSIKKGKKRSFKKYKGQGK